MRKTQQVNPHRVVELKAAGDPESSDFVLYWMQSAQRSQDNPALEYACQRANSLELPLVVCFVLTPNYPEASLRHYTFMLEGLVSCFRELRERNCHPVLRLGFPPQEIIQLSRRAAEVVMDKGYLKTMRAWYAEVLSESPSRVWQVEGEAVVPVTLASEKAEYAARTIRPRINRHLADFLEVLLPTNVEVSNLEVEVEGVELTEESLPSLLQKLEIDRSVSAVSQFFRGGCSEAKGRYQEFLREWAQDYDVQRNQPQTDYTSCMSPYLHYGMVSPVYLACQMLESLPSSDPNLKSYLEELIVRRGLSQNFCWFTPDYDKYSCLPDWAKKTLQEHADDTRPDAVSPEELERGNSHDPYWNAAQIEMVETGYMHNYMRMYWGKKILEWSESPELAYRLTLKLNNKYFLDGRDPASYGNVAWLYGVHDRAWQERAIYGKIRCMMASGLERKNDPRAYVEKVEALSGREVPGKDWLC